MADVFSFLPFSIRLDIEAALFAREVWSCELYMLDA